MSKVLIVEDNEKIAIIIRHYLLHKGLEADIASDGGAALDAFSRTAYDLLLVDIRIPVMNGDEVRAETLSAPPNCGSTKRNERKEGRTPATCSSRWGAWRLIGFRMRTGTSCTKG